MLYRLYVHHSYLTFYSVGPREEFGSSTVQEIGRVVPYQNGCPPSGSHLIKHKSKSHCMLELADKTTTGSQVQYFISLIQYSNICYYISLI